MGREMVRRLSQETWPIGPFAPHGADIGQLSHFDDDLAFRASCFGVSEGVVSPFEGKDAIYDRGNDAIGRRAEAVG
jgi:hypothetical protein